MSGNVVYQFPTTVIIILRLISYIIYSSLTYGGIILKWKSVLTSGLFNVSEFCLLYFSTLSFSFECCDNTVLKVGLGSGTTHLTGLGKGSYFGLKYPNIEYCITSNI